MKTIVITLISLLFMISASYAEYDGEKASGKEEFTKTAVVVENVQPVPDLIVVDLNETTENVGLPRDIISQLGDVMAYPKDVKDASEKECVLVEFTYDDDGYIHVANTTSTNESFDDHVVKNFEKIRLRNGSVTIGKQYYAKFSFKRL
ncbi:MAG: hypothetical protein RQ761_08535 [Bacteroidales bacterium]|nr:hypothetical protein [Bacteroidales bacterium]